MTEQNKISVIIPVFNVAPYLSKCLDSVLEQTCPDFEVIIVNDGSTDSSGQICEEYQARDSRVQVYHIENKGVSHARNYALEKATGKYLLFIDSDDYIHPDTLSILHSFVEEFPGIDCLIYPAQTENSDTQALSLLTEALPIKKPLSLVDYPQLMFLRPAMWNKLYRRQIIVDHQITFLQELAIGEDLTFYLTFIQYCQSCMYVGGHPLYHYIQRNDSVMRKIDYQKNRTLLTAFDAILSIYRTNGWYAQYRTELEYLCVYHLYIAASVRIIRADPHHPLLCEIAQYVKTHFPHFTGNSYLDLLDKNKRLIFLFLRHHWYGLIRTIFRIKQAIGGSL